MRCIAIEFLLLCALASVAAAEPMRLSDPTPRWVVVQFEDSPKEHPDRLDSVYTKPFAAWLERDHDGRVTVRVAGDVLEKSLFRENDPVPDSFSDYVWVFDPESGDVLSASFEGSFAYVIDWGFAATEVRARVAARMQTTHGGGLRGPEQVWGRRLHAWCAEPGDGGCREVEPVAYDRDRGYVNAVGYLEIDSPVTRFATYSAVGEAIFSEVPGDVAVTPPVASGGAEGSLQAEGSHQAEGSLQERAVVSRVLSGSGPAAARPEAPAR